MTTNDLHDRRVQRTRMAVFDAFRELVLSRKYDEISVAEIIAAAGVSRSTFYEHFKNKDDVLLVSIRPLFEPLAKIPAGAAESARVQFVVEHLWERRRFARIVLRDALYEKLTRKLADMIEARMEIADAAEARLQSIAAAASMLGVIRAWIGGEFSMAPEGVAARLMAVRRAISP